MQAQSTTAQLNDTLLLLIDNELLSVSTITLTAPNTYQLGVIRGRQVTTPATHGSGATVWLFFRSELVSSTYADFTNVFDGSGVYSSSIATKYFQFQLGTIASGLGNITPAAPGISFVMPNPAPAAPTSLSAVASGALITLDWAAAAAGSGIVEWRVYRETTSTAPTLPTTPYATVYGNHFIDSQATYDEEFWYWVTAVNATGESALSASATATATGGWGAGAVPSNPSAATFDDTGVSGTDDSGRTNSYIDIAVPAMPAGATALNLLFRRHAAALQWQIGAQLTNTAATEARVDDLAPGVQYDFALQAFNSAGSSAVVAATGSPFAAASDTTPPGAPSGLSALTPGGPMVTLNWSDNTEPDFDDYGVYRSTAGASGPWTAIGRLSATTFHDTGQVGGISVGTEYWYAITAFDYSDNQSGLSAVVSAIPTGVAANQTPPQNAGSVTIDGSGSAGVAGDGTVYSELDFNVPALPAAGSGTLAAAWQNLLFRVHGATNLWQVGSANLTNSSTAVVRLDRLSPNVQYDIALQAFTSFGIASGIVVATGSPFTAPQKTAQPSQPSGVSIRSPSSGDNITPIYNGNTLFDACIATWTQPTDSDIVAIETEYTTATPSNTDPVNASRLRPISMVPEVVLYTATNYGGSFYVRSVDSSGNFSNWVGSGAATSYWSQSYAGNLGSQNNSTTQLTGVQTGASTASNVRQEITRYAADIVTTIGGAGSDNSCSSGGSPTVTVQVSLSNRGFRTRADTSTTGFSTNDSNCAFRFSYDDTGNSASNAVIVMTRTDGANFNNGDPYRIQPTFIEYD